MCNIPRTKKIKALHSLIKLANKAKDLQDYRLANLTFGLIISSLENSEIKIIYENADNPLSAYYDVVTLSLNGRYLSIPAPLLNKDTLAECLKRSSIVELREHNRQYRFFESLEKRKYAFNVIASRYLRIINNYFDIGAISTALWALDMPKEFEEWCFGFLTEAATEPSLADEKTQEQGLRPHRIIEKKMQY